MKILILLSFIFIPFVSQINSQNNRISAQLLIEDTRLLIKTIENVHPDPYLRGGGKIAFHRQYHQMLEQIKNDGMNSDEYFRLLQPFFASIGDGHTSLIDTRFYDPYSPGGIPLYFETAYEGEFVAAILNEKHRDLLGALLISIEGISFDEIVDRYSKIRGADNKYLLCRNLSAQGVFWQGNRLRELIPEWIQTDSITVGLQLANGNIITNKFEIPERIDYSAFIFPGTSRPELINEFITTIAKTDFFYTFLDSDKQTCLLIIHDLMTYREAFEAWHYLGVSGHENSARNLFQRYNGTDPPEKYEDVVAGLPSATLLLKSMVKEMKAAGTKNLLIDLSQNQGGSSLFGNILIYFLYGKKQLLSLKGNTSEIIKYSDEYFTRFPTPTLDEINRSFKIPLTSYDYDLSADYADRGYPGASYLKNELESLIKWMPTFNAEYQKGEYENFYQPENIKVLCDAGTFSAAFWVMNYLNRSGAEIIGIPSAQSGNCFGDIITFELPNSGIKYNVSRKYFELYPDDPETGKVLRPDHILTHQKMASYNFDPASLILFAEDVIQRN